MLRKELEEHLIKNGYVNFNKGCFKKVIKMFEGDVMTPYNSITMEFKINKNQVYKYQATIQGRKKTHKAKLRQLSVTDNELNGLKQMILKSK